MMSKTVFWVLVVAITTVLAAPDKKCDLKDVDECTKNILPYSTHIRMGETEAEIAQDCERAAKSFTCMEEISKNGCIKGLGLGIYKLMVEGAGKENDGRCDASQPRGEEYRKHVVCLNKIGAKLQACEKKMTAEVEAALKTPVNERVPRSCCAFARMDKCLRDVARKECSEDHAKYVASIVNGVAEAAVETVCTRFNAETCKKFSQLKVSERTKFETLIPPVVEVLNV